MSDLEITRAYVRIADGQIHFRTLDGPGRPLVLLHQTASSGAMFEAMMRRMAGTRSMIALDTPGFGGSFDPASPPALSDYGKWFFEALDALGIDRFDLLGHHTGASIGVQMTADRPERIASLSLLGAVCLTAEERREYREKYSAGFPPDIEGDYLRQIWQSLRRIGGNLDLATLHREMVDTLRACETRADASNAVWDSDQAALIARTTCPLMIATAPDDVMARCLERIAALRPDAVVRTIAGGNFSPDLDPEGCVTAVTEFLSITASAQKNIQTTE